MTGTRGVSQGPMAPFFCLGGRVAKLLSAGLL